MSQDYLKSIKISKMADGPSSQSRASADTLKFYPFLHDTHKLSFIVLLEDQKLQHLKILDRSKGKKITLHKWYKLRNYEVNGPSLVLGKITNLSSTFEPQPTITAELLEAGEQLLRERQTMSVAAVKSAQIAEDSRVSVIGSIIAKGPVTPRKNKTSRCDFNVQNFRIADSTATMRVTIFNKNDLLQHGNRYLIHHAKKKVYEGRHSLEVDWKTVIQELEPAAADAPLSLAMSDDESGQGRRNVQNKISGMVTGIHYGSINIYDACSNTRCKKKVDEEGNCPNKCNMTVIKNITATIEIEFIERNNENLAVQAFTKDLDRLMGRPVSEFRDAQEYEEQFELCCPLNLKFELAQDKDGRKRLHDVTYVQTII